MTKLPKINNDALATVTDKLSTSARALSAELGVATDVLDRLDRLPDRNAIVVVGETKKGKSSLVNALVGRPGMSPVAVDVATATYLLLRHGPDQAIVQTAAGERRTIALDQLPEWVTTNGLAANPEAHDLEGNLVPQPVSVFLDSELLQRVGLIDTPGVGGLIGEHAEMTIKAVATAGVLMFVTDITVPLTDPEAAFLTRVASTSDIVDVLIVANMADKLSSDEADAAVADLRRRLQQHLPAFSEVPIVAVSAERAAKAAMDDLNEGARAILRERSGIDQLLALIDERVVARSRTVGDAVRLRILQHAAGQIVRAAEQRVDALQLDDPNDRLNDLQDAQINLQHDAETAKNAFYHELTSLKRTLNARLDSQFADLTNQLDRAAATGTSHVELEPTFMLRIDEIADDLLRLTTSGIESAARRSFQVFQDGDSDAALAFESAMTAAIAEAGAEIELRSARDYQENPLSADSIATAVIGVSSGLNLGRMLQGVVGLGGEGAAVAVRGSGIVGSGVLAGMLTLGPMAIVLGAATVTLSIHRAKKNARVTETRAWVRDRLATARRDLTDATMARLDDATTVAQMGLRNLTKQHTDQLRQEQRALRAENRPAELTAARAQVQTAVKLRGDVESRLREIGVAVGAREISTR